MLADPLSKMMFMKVNRDGRLPKVTAVVPGCGKEGLKPLCRPIYWISGAPKLVGIRRVEESRIALNAMVRVC
jgi:threonine dehydrogenase-like Zn-dependent dehydrogenase